MERVNEGSYHTITVSFTDEDGSAVTPASGIYRVDDLSSGTEIVEDTPFVPESSSYDIAIPGSSNLILNAVHDVETRTLTVNFVYGGGKAGTAEYRYWVQKLDYLTALGESS